MEVGPLQRARLRAEEALSRVLSLTRATIPSLGLCRVTQCPRWRLKPISPAGTRFSWNFLDDIQNQATRHNRATPYGTP
jgi:hypothetical protein